MGGKTKSWLRLSTVLLLSLCIGLTGCGGGNGNSGAQPEAKDSAEQTTPGTDGDKIEPFEVSVFIGQPDQQPTPDNKIYKLIREKTGASFKFEFLAGDIDQKLGVMIAGGDYPDMMTANQKLTAAGAFIPL